MQSSAGVEIDATGREVAYWRKTGNSTTYQAGKEERIPASEIIHLFKQEFTGQTRGISPLNAVMQDLKGLEDFGVAELMAAKIAAVMSLAYERQPNSAQAGDFLDEAEGDDPGSFAQELSPGQSTIVPVGYSLKAIQSNHPNNTYDSFNQAVLKRISSSLGCSYNRLLHDYSNVNFSSLKDAYSDEKVMFSDYQSFLVRNWKERQFRLFLEALALDGKFDAAKLLEARQSHHFLAPKKPYFDVSKETLAEAKQLEMGIRNPIQLIEQSGYDLDETLRGWQTWKALCQQYGVSFGKTETAVDPVEAQSDDEQLGKAHRRLTLDKYKM